MHAPKLTRKLINEWYPLGPAKNLRISYPLWPEKYQNKQSLWNLIFLGWIHLHNYLFSLHSYTRMWVWHVHEKSSYRLFQNDLSTIYLKFYQILQNCVFVAISCALARAPIYKGSDSFTSKVKILKMSLIHLQTQNYKSIKWYIIM